MKNKKIGIITLYGEVNYGNRLQNYAVCRFFQNQGHFVQTLVCQKKPTFKRRMKQIIKKIVSFVIPKFVLSSIRPTMARTNTFKKFTKKHIPTKYYYTNSGTFDQNCAEEYDMLVAGSDQVWNPTFKYFQKEYTNLLMSFVPPEKRYCISPSIGVSSIPDEWKSIFERELRKYVNLCCREDKGTQIIKELTGRDDVITTIDPTMLLTAEEWLEVARPVKGISQKYSLDYFLGKTPNEDANYKKTNEENLKIKLLDKTNKKIYISGPSEFIYLVSNAENVCTDSFHACVFAILFGKPVYVFKRKDKEEDMFSRIETLFRLFGININDMVGQAIVIDKKTRDQVLNVEKEKLVKLLKLQN